METFIKHCIFLCVLRCLKALLASESVYQLISGCEHTVVPDNNIIFQTSDITFISCGILCLNNPRCESIEYHSLDMSCNGTDVTVVAGCSNYSTNPLVLHFEQFCRNGGKLNSTGQCDCYGGWIGSRCERIMKNCLEGVPYGTIRGYYLVQPTLAPQLFQIYCLTNGRYHMLIRHTNPTINFTRPWLDYKRGFSANGTQSKHELWLGLDNLHYLTQDLPYVLYTVIRISNDTDYKAVQQGFQVGNESTNYKMMFESSKYNLVNYTLGNCLDELNGQPFSTYDNDNDNDTDRNCALDYHGGYWFNACASCNPTGELTRPDSGFLDGVDSEINWKNNLGDIAPFKIRQTLVPWWSEL